eukprot:CAMPEP_0113546396 /NCGR_PEP_ID=MMETSP0015_2-20120614/11781_1 /TAXON_ID=2838 /ORGANISM="Odontella" /LENGTH=68 /DNA_ID=CAMNT_0000446843 /DNA_START=70 /DNA_END=273 /DNA_ORIENTATION=+ /assembly_acc=CAM_ASM_000160
MRIAAIALAAAASLLASPAAAFAPTAFSPRTSSSSSVSALPKIQSDIRMMPEEPKPEVDPRRKDPDDQ